MVEASYVASAGLTALVLVAVLVVLARSRHRHPTLHGTSGSGPGYGYYQAVDRWAERPSAWFVAFLLVTLGAFAAFMGVIAGTGPFGAPTMYAGVVAAGLGAVFGAYILGKNAGFGTAGGVLIAGLLLGIVIIVSIVGALYVA